VPAVMAASFSMNLIGSQSRCEVPSPHTVLSPMKDRNYNRTKRQRIAPGPQPSKRFELGTWCADEARPVAAF